MIIPDKIRIGGQDIHVVNEERHSNNLLGEICVAEGVLRIADNFNNRQQCESSKIATFIHEVVHGILDTMGESELSGNEKFVCTFSSLLVDTIEEIVKVNKGEMVHINRFISAKEALPKQDEEVIVLCDDLNVAPNYKISFGHIVDKTICQDYNGWNIPNVVYWFPMPKLPNK